jgi:hypothetical protein
MLFWGCELHTCMSVQANWVALIVVLPTRNEHLQAGKGAHDKTPPGHNASE